MTGIMNLIPASVTDKHAFCAKKNIEISKHQKCPQIDWHMIDVTTLERHKYTQIGILGNIITSTQLKTLIIYQAELKH